MYFRGNGYSLENTAARTAAQFINRPHSSTNLLHSGHSLSKEINGVWGFLMSLSNLTKNFVPINLKVLLELHVEFNESAVWLSWNFGLR